MAGRHGPRMILVFGLLAIAIGRLPPPSERLLSYLIVSTIYLALSLPYIEYKPDLGLANPSSMRWLFWLFLLPTLVGLGLTLLGSPFRKLLMIARLKPVHPIPNAWDWKFSNTSVQWVLVTLTDGSQVAGLLGVQSFVSSDPTERDIYIDQVYGFNPDSEEWTAADGNGILIAGGQVKTIEFWPYDTGKERENEDS